jgi:urease accessory protein
MSLRARSARPALLAIAGAAAVFLAAGPAAAHTGTGLPGGFVSGVEHPLQGGDHLLAMVAVGLWGAFLGRPLVFALPVVFPGMMVVGAIIGMFGVPLPSVEAGIAVSVLTLGACIAFAARPPAWVAVVIVAVFALFHGDAHGRELPSAADPVGYSVGFVLATGLLHVSGIALAALAEARGALILARSAGGGIALAGGWLLVRAAVG